MVQIFSIIPPTTWGWKPSFEQIPLPLERTGRPQYEVIVVVVVVVVVDVVGVVVAVVVVIAVLLQALHC